MYMKKIFLKFSVTSLLVAPFSVFAIEDAFQISIRILGQIQQIVTALLPVVFALAILAFFWGIFLYVFSTGETKKVEGKHVMLWSLIALFIMTSLYGIIAVAQSTLGIPVGGGGTFQLPQIGGQNPQGPF